jgi:signal transduction histidine kinase
LFSNWPIRVKLLVGLGLLVVMVTILSSSGLYSTYAYRNLVKSLSGRINELPLAAEVSRHVSNLRVALSELRGLRATSFPELRDDLAPLRVRMVREQFRAELDEVDGTLDDYRKQVEQTAGAGFGISDNQPERDTVRKIEAALGEIRAVEHDRSWIFHEDRVARLDSDLGRLQILASELPSHLQAKLGGFAAEVRLQYRTLIVGTWVASVTAALVFALFVRLFYRWIFRPLRTLIRGSREVAGGNFAFRIHVNTRDEIAALAEAMNDMTRRFQDIRDDLDRQVQERTKQVVRNEQLASVGFLAAGVAHEINNPLASIALCAESLEGRIAELLESAAPGGTPGGAEDKPDAGAASSDDQSQVIGHYLRMIQSEAFRCKEITEKLLDFSRLGQAKRQDAELGELVQGVLDMLGHLGKYQRKRLEFAHGGPVVAPVNAQEIKQVVLNLLTNALDSVEEGGTVRIELTARDDMAELSVTDDGCGMEPAVLDRVFEPFFTRRRAGQGTGLGLSIAHRIVADHGGTIEAHSAGPGRGAVFLVRLPLSQPQKETKPRSQAA